MSNTPFGYPPGSEYSTAQSPASPAPTVAGRNSFLGAISGPVLLIVLGGLFALDYMAGIGIARTWPVILIVAGLFKLLEYMGARS